MATPIRRVPSHRSIPVQNPWFRAIKPVARPSLRLFCFPYAGGSGSIYQGWPAGLPTDVEVWTAQLPGRGPRLQTPAQTRLGPLLEDLSAAITPWLDDAPFAFFGHSLGALVAFELTRRLRRIGAPQPVRLCVSGRRAPHLPEPAPPIHGLPDAAFIERVRRLNGTSNEVLENKELMALVLPSLRADFELAETWSFLEEEPLSCALTVCAGLAEFGLWRDDIESWAYQTEGQCDVHFFPGDHFFIHSAATKLVATIGQTLHTDLGERHATLEQAG